MLVDVSIHPREEDSSITPSFEGNQAIQGVTAGIAEMLMQSHSGEISLLPALPNDWKTGSVTGLRGLGGYNIDVAWENGDLKESVIQSVVSQKCRIRTKLPVKILSDGQLVESLAGCDGVVDFQAEAGKKYKVVPL
jgi:alpha-L-fucosidase 2